MMENEENKIGEDPPAQETNTGPEPPKKHEAKHERTTQKLISEMIGKYIGIEEKRALFLRDGAEAWREYRERGLRVTSRELVSWLELWNDEDESEGPECHR